MNQNNRNMMVWALIAGIVFIFVQLFPGSSSSVKSHPQLAMSDFLSEVNSGRVESVTLKDGIINGRTTDGRSFTTYYVPLYDPSLPQRLLEKGIKFDISPPEELSYFWQVIINWLPLLFLVGLSFFSLRQLQSGGNKAMGFGKSRARLLGEKGLKVTFQDVAGIEEAKSELQEVVEFLKDPQKFQRLGGKIPRGVLLVGPPGTGKTLLARAIAGEAGVPFFSISGSDFVEMFVGVGASRVRDMFEQAKKNAPCIIFIDEIDAVGRHRGAGLGGGNDEREQTLNQLLVEMDGFEENEGVILVAATNRPDVLDPALLRPGRFDRQVVVPNPDVAGREQILKVHVKKVPLAPNVDLKIIARGTPGFSGADLSNLVNEAALMAARKGKLAVGMSELEQAKDKVMMGAERRSMVMSEDEKKLTAYHEAGHAILAYYLEDSDPIHKATIIPRGRALGMVMRLPENDRISLSKSKLLADIKVAMGGRLAEEMFFGADRVTTGASSDIKGATEWARRMVTEWGLSDKLGFQAFSEPQQEVFLGHSVTQTKHISDATALLVDQEIKAILDTCYAQARSLLEEKRAQLESLAKALLVYETLSGDDIKGLLEEGKNPDPEPLTQEVPQVRASVPLTAVKEEPTE